MSTIEIIEYPWEGSEIYNGDSFLLFGYGSLVNQVSAKDVVSAKKLTPCYALGVKRVFNYSPDEIVLSRPMYQDASRGKEYSAALNLVPTANEADKPNGVVMEVYRNEIPDLVKRERGYSLIKVRCINFFDASDSMEAYALSAPEYYDNRQLVDNSLLPNVSYYQLCKQGAKNISESFLTHWMETTFIGSGIPVADWENKEGF